MYVLFILLQAPDWSDQNDSSSARDNDQVSSSKAYHTLSTDATEATQGKGRTKAEAEIVAASDSDSDEENETEMGQKLNNKESHDHKEVHDEEPKVEEEEIDHKSRRARARALMKQKARGQETMDNTETKRDATEVEHAEAPSLAQFDLPASGVSVKMSSLPVNANKSATEQLGSQDKVEQSHATKDDSDGKESSGESESGESSSESESSESDDEDYPTRTIAKPVFRKKEERDTIQEKLQEEKEEEERQKREEKEREQQREESRKLVVEEVEKEKEAEKQDDDPTMPDDEDRSDDEEIEFNEWRLRELYRIKRYVAIHDTLIKRNDYTMSLLFTCRDRDERLRNEWERAETERRRNLTPEERAKEDRELEKQGFKTFKKEKRKLGFMQKYYHRGVFYMDEDSVQKDDVRKRSYDAPTGEDRIDKTQLPGVMQVRGSDFGKRSRTKWTHLAAEDTLKDTPWAQKDHLRQQFAKRMAGVKQDLDEAGRVVRGKRRRIVEQQTSDSSRKNPR